jgi:DNA repair exonuclease SbcCD nuclease subunit
MIRVLQLSDVHFGAPLSGGLLGMSETTARQREDEKRDAFRAALGLVFERNLDGVLLPGDLFDDESVSEDLLRFVRHQLAELAPRPVFVAPGNHDPFGGTSPYNPRALGAARGFDWPDNVILFAHEEFRTVRWPDRPEIAVTGCGVIGNVPAATRRLQMHIPRPEADLSILLFHGSRDDGGWLQSHKATYPFSREEMLAQSFDWVALGHYHRRQMLVGDEGRARGAYSGCLIATGLDEIEDHGALVVEITRDAVRVEPVEIDGRRVHRLTCDLTGSTFREDARSRVETVLQAAGVERHDLVLLDLQGRRAPGLDLTFLDQMAETMFHFRADTSQLIPDVELENYPSLEDATTTEQRFVARLRRSLGDSDGEGAARRALLYGLDALNRGRLDTRYEE